jgi:hypothetical protein
MAQLRPCPSCSRHVSGDETRCPFCEAALAIDATSSSPPTRLARAAAMAVGAAVATASFVACDKAGTAVNAPTDSTLGDAGVTTQGGSNVDGAPVVSPPDYSNMAKPYGAPPADGLPRIV